MIKCLAFDFDGVLVASNAVKQYAYFAIFAHLGATRPAIEAVLEDNQSGGRHQVIERIIRLLVCMGLLNADDPIDELVEKYAERYNDICEPYASTCDEIAGASECLPRLATHYWLYVNSATPEEPLRRIIQRRGWSAYFQSILGSPRTKSENLAQIWTGEKLGGDQIVFVGDSQQDLAAALECGCRFVSMRNQELVRPGVVMVDDLFQLEKRFGKE